MALLVPAYPDPQGVPGDEIANAYAWIEHISLGFSDGSGRIAVWVHRSADAANSWTDPGLPNVPAADRIEFRAGDGVIPALSELLAEPTFAQAFGYIRQRLYAAIKTDPRFANAGDAP